MVMDRWYVIAWTPDGIHVFALPMGLEDQGSAASRARFELGFPDGYDQSPWDMSLSPGEPHHSILEAATFHDWTGGVPS